MAALDLLTAQAPRWCTSPAVGAPAPNLRLPAARAVRRSGVSALPSIRPLAICGLAARSARAPSDLVAPRALSSIPAWAAARILATPIVATPVLAASGLAPPPRAIYGLAARSALAPPSGRAPAGFVALRAASGLALPPRAICGLAARSALASRFGPTSGSFAARARSALAAPLARTSPEDLPPASARAIPSLASGPTGAHRVTAG